MRTGDAFPGKRLKAQDLAGRRVMVVIDKVVQEDIGDDTKPVLYFKGKDKTLVLNRTNCNTIEAILGTDEMDEWTGGAITLYQAMTDFQGKRVPCIRVEETPPKAQNAPARKPAPPPEPERRHALTEEEFNAPDDDVPF